MQRGQHRLNLIRGYGRQQPARCLGIAQNQLFFLTQVDVVANEIGKEPKVRVRPPGAIPART